MFGDNAALALWRFHVSPFIRAWMPRLLLRLFGALMLLALLGLPVRAVSATTRAAAIDLPACEATAPGMETGVSLGLTQPHASPATVAYAATLAAERDDIEVCSESWHRVLPRFLPWAPALERGIGFVFFAAAFLIAVAGLYAATPRIWWQRTTLLGVLSVSGTTWLLGVGMLLGFHAFGAQRLVYDTAVSLRLPRQARPEWFDVTDARALEALLDDRGHLKRESPPSSRPQPVQSNAKQRASTDPPVGEYLVRHRLNLRAGPGVQSDWLAFVERGEKLVFDGARDGDWWRVRTAAGRIGWASSLWMRRPAEMIPGKAGRA